MAVEAAPDAGAPVPAGWRLRRDPSLRTPAGGTVLVGGVPLRVLTLSPAGARVVSGWWDGAAVGETGAQRGLARRLLDAGFAHPDPPAGPGAEELTVIVPVKDRPGELDRCLAAIAAPYDVVVVDDGSTDPGAIADVARRHGATCLRLEPSRGPSAARNAGLRAARTPFVAFVDSDVVVGPAFPGRLLDHLGDPLVGVVAPRVVALEGDGGWLTRYEARHSALDMGGREGHVQPRTAIPYAPSATLVARREALGEGFDETLDMGEDVDLLWRVHAAGWRVRYDPGVRVAHDHRVELRSWFSRRIAYNESNAALVARHPREVPAVILPAPSAAFWLALAAGRRGVAAGLTAFAAARLARQLRPHLPAPARTAARLTLQSRLHEGRHVARALTGPWLPLWLGVALVRPRVGRRIAAGIGVSLLAEWWLCRRELGPAAYAAPRAAEDLARCIGVWRGCVRERSLRALLPQVPLSVPGRRRRARAPR